MNYRKKEDIIYLVLIHSCNLVKLCNCLLKFLSRLIFYRQVEKNEYQLFNNSMFICSYNLIRINY